MALAVVGGVAGHRKGSLLLVVRAEDVARGGSGREGASSAFAGEITSAREAGEQDRQRQLLRPQLGERSGLIGRHVLVEYRGGCVLGNLSARAAER